MVVLEARGLTHVFRAVRALADVSLTLRRGEIHAVIGPNGAGKTTLIRLLAGDLRPRDGDIVFDGTTVTAMSVAQRARRGLARSFQRTTLFANFSALENVRLALQARGARPISPFRRAATPALKEAALAALARAGLADRAAERAGSLSYGEQRQLEIAVTVAARPRAVLLDEPFAGLGMAERRSMVASIAALRHDHALLLVEHDMDAVFALADRITVLARGEVVASGTPQAVRADPKARAAYLGEPLA